MIYGSVCSGIESATVAWGPLGFRPAFFSEIDLFPSAVLAHRYPAVPNRGDMTSYRSWPDDPTLDLLVGGTPCQSFSVAGLRHGLDDPRGNLTLVFLGLVDRLRPRWILWENVPGVLSVDRGRAFGAFLGGLAQLGYGFAWRVLDAQHFGLAQRRKRVFVVGHLGDWRRAAAVLLERSCLRGDPPPGRTQGEDLAGTLAASTGGSDENDARDGRLIASNAEGSDGFTLTRANLGKTVNNQTPLVLHRSSVRRLTPLECERLQGLPDHWTRIPWRNKTPELCPDGPRYKAIGNSMAVPVVRWIGQRIAQVDGLA